MHTTARPAPTGRKTGDALKDPFETVNVSKGSFRASGRDLLRGRP